MIYFFKIIVLFPVNLKFDMEMIVKFCEENFERALIKLYFIIDQMNFKIDPKQLSDLLDFIKFQNYSIFYGYNYFISLFSLNYLF